MQTRPLIQRRFLNSMECEIICEIIVDTIILQAAKPQVAHLQYSKPVNEKKVQWHSTL